MGAATAAFNDSTTAAWLSAPTIDFILPNNAQLKYSSAIRSVRRCSYTWTARVAHPLPAAVRAFSPSPLSSSSSSSKQHQQPVQHHLAPVGSRSPSITNSTARLQAPARWGCSTSQRTSYVRWMRAIGPYLVGHTSAVRENVHPSIYLSTAVFCPTPSHHPAITLIKAGIGRRMPVSQRRYAAQPSMGDFWNWYFLRVDQQLVRCAVDHRRETAFDRRVSTTHQVGHRKPMHDSDDVLVLGAGRFGAGIRFATELSHANTRELTADRMCIPSPSVKQINYNRLRKQRNDGVDYPVE